MAPHNTETPFDLKIIAALAYGGRAWDKLWKPAGDFARGIIRAHAPDVPADMYDDVVQEALMLLHRRGADSLDPAKGSASTMFGWLTREAIRTVRASMIAAGAPTRQRKPNGAPPLPPIVYDEAVSPVKLTTEVAIAAVENSIITAQVLAMAPKSIARGLRMIHLEGRTVEAAAKAASLSRFQLSRQIFAFAIEMRAAA